MSNNVTISVSAALALARAYELLQGQRALVARDRRRRTLQLDGRIVHRNAWLDIDRGGH
jgi:hypothetical protein